MFIILRNLIKYFIAIFLLFSLFACTTTKKVTTPKIKITNISQKKASKKLLKYSLSLIGTPYKYGGNSTKEGFDCSGLIVNIYKNVLGVNLPRTAKTLSLSSKKISKRKLRIGDLVFFNTNGYKFSHVGMYIGKNKFINAPSSKKTVRINNLNEPYYLKRFTGARTFF